MATYSGKEIAWKDAINSNISLCDVDALNDMENDVAPVLPDEDGNYPIPVPGLGYKKIIDWELAGRKKKKKKTKTPGPDKD